ncbi:hypothetical protein [Amycolatopsis suaedae]|uniref:Uncharacterized protein n=1 Tax=Amycolatopsis suaedae TaxID=2510978 RepID=A0A4Q7JCP2_9PSEU|nr:hypothetical protein [Amycolatopsis suaedae]RZQ65109.1 hypothetical protein EWH70_04215 [Amycolatopsis suaedae]
MNGVTLSPTQIVAGVAVLVVVFMVWRAGSRKAKRAADAARAGARAVSLTGRVLLMAAAFVGVQWLVISNPGNPTLLIVVLALPDLIAAYVLTRALTLTPPDGTTTGRRHYRRGGERR